MQTWQMSFITDQGRRMGVRIDPPETRVHKNEDESLATDGIIRFYDISDDYATWTPAPGAYYVETLQTRHEGNGPLHLHGAEPAWDIDARCMTMIQRLITKYREEHDGDHAAWRNSDYRSRY